MSEACAPLDLLPHKETRSFLEGVRHSRLEGGERAFSVSHDRQTLDCTTSVMHLGATAPVPKIGRLLRDVPGIN